MRELTKYWVTIEYNTGKVVICTFTLENHEFQRKKGKTYFLAASAILFVWVTNGVILPLDTIWIIFFTQISTISVEILTQCYLYRSKAVSYQFIWQRNFVTPFLECDFASNVWTCGNQKTKSAKILDSDYSHCWSTALFWSFEQATKNKLINTVISETKWGIWKYRNNCKHNYIHLPIPRLLRKLFNDKKIPIWKQM
jgi:hypothetical protein